MTLVPITSEEIIKRRDAAFRIAGGRSSTHSTRSLFEIDENVFYELFGKEKADNLLKSDGANGLFLDNTAYHIRYYSTIYDSFCAIESYELYSRITGNRDLSLNFYYTDYNYLINIPITYRDKFYYKYSIEEALKICEK